MALAEIVQVNHAMGAYPVVIQPGLIDSLGGWLAPYVSAAHVTVITDENVWEALGERLTKGLNANNVALLPVIIPAGEASKSWKTLASVTDRLLDFGVERCDTLLALGGGVVGDLTGFAAAILKRGCHHIQVPTSLLAQVDSAVGGKTGINTRAGKNLVGAFNQPRAVFIDPTTLVTLPERHVRAGYAEIVKYGLISDSDFFSWCENHGAAVISGDNELIAEAIAVSVASKAAIVATDERELSGARALLNFGHTFGHALEAETGFGDLLLHGEAVALGICLALRFSVELERCPRSDAERVAGHFAGCGLATRLCDIGIETSGAALAAHMRYDKKSVGGRPSLVLARGIGDVFVDDSISLDRIAQFLDRELGAGHECHAALR